MSLKIFNDLNMNLNEAKEFVIEKLASAPDPSEARIYFNTTDDNLYVYDGAEWVNATDSDELSAATKEPSGFIEPENVVVSYNSTTRAVTLAGTVTCLWRGRPITEIISGWESPAHAENPQGNLFLKYDGSTFSWSTIPWAFTDVQIALLVVEDGQIFCVREPHGLMQWQSHENLHKNIGTYKYSGGALSNYTLSSVTATDKRPQVQECVLYDEDVKTTIPALTTNAYTSMYLSEANTVNLDIDQTEIVPLSGNGLPLYNQWNGTSFVQTEMPKDKFMSLWVMAVPASADSGSQKYRYLFLQGQSISNTLAEQRGVSSLSLNLGDFQDVVPEFVHINQIILTRTGNSSGNWAISEVNTLLGSRSQQVGLQGSFLTSVSAYQVSYDNTTSGLTATQVQAAIDEVNIKATVNNSEFTGNLNGKTVEDVQDLANEVDDLVFEGTGATNLAQGTRTETTVLVTSSTGTDATLEIATTSLAGVMSSADKSKLDGIATEAEVNVQADWNQTNTSADDFIKNKPVTNYAIQRKATVAQSIANDSVTKMTTSTTIHDTSPSSNMWDSSTSEIIIRKAGIYRVYASAIFSTNATGGRAIIIKKGTTWVAYDSRSASPFVTGLHTNVDIELAVNDKITVELYQNSGGALGTYISSPLTETTFYGATLIE